MTDRNPIGTIRHNYLLIENGLTLYFMGATELYIDKALVIWKGMKYICKKNLARFRIIDLSSNKIEGEIPRELSSLSELNQLNLSNNKLSDIIPEEIGCLKQLESLDLSQNQLSGKLPSSMAGLNFLNTLNLSYNDLSGRIPSSNQLQSFSASVFIGNHALCGLPLTQKCPEESTTQAPKSSTDSQQNQEDGDNEFRRWLYAGMGLGFIVGFWGVSCTLLLKRSWRHAYFQLLDKLADRLYVTLAVYRRRLQQKSHS
ncbi:serine-threonine protein kinase, plant-type, putative [Ricinus communis]|uniref:Serine-threonine protein kinase, plant-type, putative n=1 Tax=Ricinus communis TaxID=3988 RepID=B9SJG5_RICCO|nr:serine-threonine protein kinase, plant-type, putative [Ricinus communis]